MVTKLIMRLAFWMLYSKAERIVLRDVVSCVSVDERIPVYTKDEYRHGHEARHDFAVDLAEKCLPHMRDSLLNLGVEMAHWLSKCR